jgi:hypothetical protein
MNLADIKHRLQPRSACRSPLAVPYVMEPLAGARNTNTRELVERYQTQAHGIGDMSLACAAGCSTPIRISAATSCSVSAPSCRQARTT